MNASRMWMLIPALLLVAPIDLDAQGRGKGNRRNGDGRTGEGRNGNGPAFCRSGAGHPVHGWEWCREKGWDRADRDFGRQRDDRRDDDRDDDRDQRRDEDRDRRSRTSRVPWPL